MVNRIAYFVADFPSKSETWVHHEIIQLMQEGFSVKVFSRNKKPSFVVPENYLLVKNTEYRDKFFLVKIFKNPVRNLKIFYRVLKEIWKDFLNDTKGLRGKLQVLKDLALFVSSVGKIKSFNPDIVIVHFANAKANPAVFNNILFKTPYIIKMHAVDVFLRPNLFRLKVELAYKILSISNYNIEFITKRDRDIDISKFIVHHCGMPVEKYEFKPVLDRKSSIPTVLSVGRLTPMKGFDTLIKACSELHKKNIKHKLIIVGFGPDKDLLINLSNNFGIQHSVEFRDYCSPEEVKNLLYSSDLFVLAAKFDTNKKTQDGIPVAIMEAMSIGLPVITTRTSGIPELINDNTNGFLVNPDDPLDLAKKIEEVLNISGNRLCDIVKNARLKIETDFNLVKLTNELKELVASVN